MFFVSKMSRFVEENYVVPSYRIKMASAVPELPPLQNHFEMKKKKRESDKLIDKDKLSYYSATDNYGGKRETQNLTSDYETLIHLLKGNIGTGCLAMPQAFMNIGLWVGLFGLPIIGAFTTHCMHILLNSSRELCRRTGRACLTYEETAEISFLCGPEVFHSWSRTFYQTIMYFLIVTQIGFCCVYLVFVSQNIFQAVECISGGTQISSFDYMLITLLPILLICFLPNLKYLALVSTLAMICQFVGLVIIFYYLIRGYPESDMPTPAFAGWSSLPLFFGTAMYTFEGINLVLPLENNMKNPDHFPGWGGVLNSGMVLVISLYTAIGFLGYLRYGNTVLGSITLNLPGEEPLAQSVKILMACAIFMSYPLQFYVPLSILLPPVRERISSRYGKCIAEYSLRTAIVLITFGLASAIPNIALFTNLIGTVCSSTLVLIFPPLIDSVTFWPETGKYNWKLYKNIFISCLGLVGFATGAYTSMKSIIDYYRLDDPTIGTGC